MIWCLHVDPHAEVTTVSEPIYGIGVVLVNPIHISTLSALLQICHEMNGYIS